MHGIRVPVRRKSRMFRLDALNEIDFWVVLKSFIGMSLFLLFFRVFFRMGSSRNFIWRLKFYWEAIEFCISATCFEALVLGASLFK